MGQHTTTLRRFAGHQIDPAQVRSLSPDHPAVVEGRTIFPSTVVPTLESPRLLVSGHNNPKLGKEITKGPRKGWPIFQLTLQERATCPRSCAQWAGCYGNSMNQARRHTPDAYFLPRLRAEVAALAREYPEGFLVRLHTLGDFYSVEYVLAWAEIVAEHPALHAFGYTARRVDDEDPETRRIARAVRLLTEGAWDRFAIRTSDVLSGRGHSIVVDEDPEHPSVIVCPAQTHDTETCGTCGLCWSGAARDKTIAFLRHGMTTRREPRKPKLVETRAPEPSPLRTGKGGRLPPPMPEGSPQAPGFSAYQTASMAKVLATLIRTAAGQTTVTISFSVLSREAGVPHGSISFLLDSLAKRGLIAIERGTDRRPNTYTILGAEPGDQPVTSGSPQPVSVTAPEADPPIVVPPALAAPPAPPPVPAPVARAMRQAADIDLSMLVESEPAAAGVQRTLLTLQPGECRWPLGEAGRDGQGYCGEKAAGATPYCSKHLARMHQPKAAKKSGEARR